MYVPTLADRVHGSAALRRRQAFGRVLAHLLGRIEVSGLQHLPATGPVVLAANHRDFLDGPVLFGFIHRPVNFLVKVEAFTPRASPFLSGTGQIPVVRGRLDFAAVRLSLQILRDGGIIGVFPEGSRGDGLVRSAKPGVGYFALRTGAPVVPVACHGTDSLTHHRGARRPLVRITIGAPLELGSVPAGRPVNRRAVVAATEQVRATLAELVAETRLPAALAAAA